MYSRLLSHLLIPIDLSHYPALLVILATTFLIYRIIAFLVEIGLKVKVD